MPPYRHLKSFKDRHAGKRAIVMGLGPSLARAKQVAIPHDVITIGVNDIVKTGIKPTYLVVLDMPMDMANRQRFVWTWEAFRDPVVQHVFVGQPNPWLNVPLWGRKNPMVAKLAKPVGGDFASKMVHMPYDQGNRTAGYLEPLPYMYKNNCIPAKATSPLPAAALAGFLGCTRIGLLGVDHTAGLHATVDNHDSEPLVNKSLDQIHSCFRNLDFQLRKLPRPSRLVQLSPDSAITLDDNMTLEEFVGAPVHHANLEG